MWCTVASNGFTVHGFMYWCNIVRLCKIMSSGEYGARLSSDVRSCEMVLLYIQDLSSAW